MARSGWRTTERDYFRWATCDDDAVGIPGVQLADGRICWGDDGFGDDGGGCGNNRQSAARPYGDAAILRISHGRLLPALDQDAEVAEGDAAYFPRQLVPERGGWKFYLAG